MSKSRNKSIRFAIGLVYLTVLLYGVVLGLAADELTFFMMNIFVIAAVSIWVRFDARRQNVALPGSMQLFIYLLFPFAVSVYLIWTRGFWKGLGWTVLHVFGFLATMIVGYVAILQVVN